MNIDQSFLIALADDDTDDRELFVEAMKGVKKEADVLLFEDGKPLLDYLKNEENPLPRIIFMDFNMPVHNGMHSLRLIRSEARLRKLCVVIYSTSGNERDIDDAYEYGANGYIIKPASFNALQRVIRKVIDSDWICSDSRPGREALLL